MNGRKELMDSLVSVIDLLNNCQMSNKVEWFFERLQRIKNDSSDLVLIEVAKEVRSVIAGIGSYTDLSLQPSVESGMSEMDAQKMQWSLADDMDTATCRILQLGSSSAGGASSTN
jgi:secreted Zn-dependent insulinase-like peptidase